MNFTFLLLIIFSLYAQKSNNTVEATDKIKITGHWEGTFTRDEGGGKRIINAIQLDVLQRKKEVTGISYMNYEVEDKTYYAKFDVQGKINGNYFKFIETNIIISDSIPQAAWCIKKGELIYRKLKNIETLEGLGEGVSALGSCMPGRIFLERKPPKV